MMTFLRRTSFAAALVFAMPALAEAPAPVAADPARIAAAHDLMEVTGVIKQLDAMIEAMKKGFAHTAKAGTSERGKQASADFDAAANKFMSYKGDMVKDFAELYAESFTAEEMKSIADFYRSGAGAKFIATTPALMQKGSVLGMKYTQKVIEALKADEKSAPAAPK